MTNSKRCYSNDCKSKINKVIGHCKYCEYNFCGPHRLPENHDCENIHDCRDEAYLVNEQRLIDGKIKSQKIILI